MGLFKIQVEACEQWRCGEFVLQDGAAAREGEGKVLAEGDETDGKGRRADIHTRKINGGETHAYVSQSQVEGRGRS